MENIGWLNDIQTLSELLWPNNPLSLMPTHWRHKCREEVGRKPTNKKMERIFFFFFLFSFSFSFTFFPFFFFFFFLSFVDGWFWIIQWLFYSTIRARIIKICILPINHSLKNSHLFLILFAFSTANHFFQSLFIFPSLLLLIFGDWENRTLS